MFSKHSKGDLLLLPETNEVEVNKKRFKLKPKEMGVLNVLVDRSNSTVSRTELLEEVWGIKFANDQGLTQAISRIRSILSKHSKISIRTIPKKGYVLENHRITNKAEDWSIRVNLKVVFVCLLVIVIFLLLFIQRIEIRIDEVPKQPNQFISKSN